MVGALLWISVMAMVLFGLINLAEQLLMPWAKIKETRLTPSPAGHEKARHLGSATEWLRGGSPRCPNRLKIRKEAIPR